MVDEELDDIAEVTDDVDSVTYTADHISVTDSIDDDVLVDENVSRSVMILELADVKELFCAFCAGRRWEQPLNTTTVQQ